MTKLQYPEAGPQGTGELTNHYITYKMSVFTGRHRFLKDNSTEQIKGN